MLDANGLDITDITEVEFESTASKDGKTITQLDAGKQTFVYVVVKDKDGKELAKSERITVKAENAKAVKLLDYAVADKAPNFEKKDEIVKTVRSDDKGDKAKSLFLNLEDQFGKSIRQDGVKFESLNKEVALVDQNNGKITPLKVGTVDVRVTIGDVNEIIQITVEEAAKVASIELDKAEINLSDKLAEGQDVKVTVKDQYGEKATDAEGKVTFKVKEGNEIITVGEKSAKGPEATFTIKPIEGKEGKAVVEFSYKDGDDTFKTTLTVNVAKADVVDNYVVEGFEKELDKYEGKDKKNITSMTLRVFGVDANGIKTGEVTENLKIELYKGEDKVTEEGEGALSDKTINANELEKDTEYKVVVKVGTLTIFEDTFTVVDTKPEEAKPVVEQVKSSIKVEINSDLQEALKDAFKVTKDGENVTITSFTYLSDNAAVIDKTGIKGSGTATLVITKVNDIEVPNLMVNVKVGILTAPEGKTEFTIKLEGDAKLDIKYLAFGLMNEAGKAQKVATLDEVKKFIDSKYGVNFKASNIVLDEESKTLSIKGELLSTADWNKVKENGDKTIPYRITVLNKDKTNKLVKIAMYEDGVAIFEAIK